MKVEEVGKLLQGTFLNETNRSKEIGAIAIDSRTMRKNDVFLCLLGKTLDGHNFIEDALLKKPSLIIVIDALASMSIERVNKTIQITDTGIEPGSGVGNVRKEISFDTVGVPVIALGVPTVVSAVTIVSDTIEYMTKYFTYVKSNINKPSSKLVPSGYVNYLKEDIGDNLENDVELLGKIGTLNDYEKREFIYEILNPTGYNLMVTPKEVDFVIEKLSLLISEALNISIHKEYKIK